MRIDSEALDARSMHCCAQGLKEKSSGRHMTLSLWAMGRLRRPCNQAMRTRSWSMQATIEFDSLLDDSAYNCCCSRVRRKGSLMICA